MNNLERFKKAINWEPTDRVLTYDFLDNRQILIEHGGYLLWSTRWAIIPFAVYGVLYASVSGSRCHGLQDRLDEQRALRDRFLYGAARIGSLAVESHAPPQ